MTRPGIELRSPGPLANTLPTSQTNEKTSRNKTLLLKCHQRDKHLGSPFCKILWTILNVDKKGTQKNEPEDKEIGNYAQGLTPEK